MPLKTIKECPICGKPTDPGSKVYPFCSDRCKVVDLANWASEGYVIHRPLREEEKEASADKNEEEM